MRDSYCEFFYLIKSMDELSWFQLIGFCRPVNFVLPTKSFQEVTAEILDD